MDLNGVQLTWLGHSTFRIQTPGGKIVLIDPWVMSNPACPESEKKPNQIDAMLITHGHFDHMGDAVELAKQHNPMVVGIYELCSWLQKKGVQQVSPMNKGGSQQVGDIKVTMTHALHSSSIADGEQLVYAGEACGYIVEFQNGLKLYHTGDTSVFSDMNIIHELYKPELVLLPIGDHFIMSPAQAAYAIKLLRPKAVVPMHFGTFPVLTGTPAELRRLVSGMGVEVLELKPGQTIGAETAAGSRR
jgi:L-ascorbate metabolism protein UlaG (beta-lactamase superfamily)